MLRADRGRGKLGSESFGHAQSVRTVHVHMGDATVREASAVTTTAVILSVLALILSLASLGWQTWTWARSGPVLRVKVAAILTDAGGLSADPAFYLQTTVVNRGRAAATING